MVCLGVFLNIALGLVVSTLSLSLGLVPCALGLTCKPITLSDIACLLHTFMHQTQPRQRPTKRTAIANTQLTLGVFETPLGFRVVLDDVVQDEASGNNGSGDQDLKARTSADEA